MDPGAPFQFPAAVEGCSCVVCSRTGVPINQNSDATPVFTKYRLVKENADGTTVELTEEEIAEFEKRFPKHAEWNFPSQQQQWYKACQKLLDTVSKHKWANPFKVPVDYIAFQIPDYPTVIKHPMDLGTVRQKLKTKEYTDPEQMISDVRLTFRNAFVYNKKETDIWIMAEAVSKYFEGELLALQGGAAPPV
eukprot:CAMPEP_0175090840 /NCGR_PEP_ID=MMETSP0086_2-20121207/1576_1 /TAXON_ID=136419 /ORGANISM="Unknown Unknown, Strain D1" /LENGTH=191 /DNA_ID=CAMNT_0016363527 /DNA_START=73 /DNA_END=648 /DNA_ORIENTATION=+